MAKKKRRSEPVEDWAGTEKDWIAARDPRDVLGQLFWLHEQGRIRTTERKWGLFQVACLRRVQHLFQDERSRMAVDDNEAYADGQISHEELFQRGSRAVNPPNPDNFSGVPREACSADQLRVSEAWDALAATGPQAHGIYTFHDYHERCEILTSAAASALDKSEAEVEVLARLLRDIFGNPFRAVAVNPTWLTPTVTSLATAAYEERSLPSGELDAARLAILADALEEAGCSDTTILDHLRSTGPHVRGCWSVDLLLGRE
jgi:hypothetical protein